MYNLDRRRRDRAVWKPGGCCCSLLFFGMDGVSRLGVDGRLRGRELTCTSEGVGFGGLVCGIGGGVHFGSRVARAALVSDAITDWGIGCMGTVSILCSAVDVGAGCFSDGCGLRSVKASDAFDGWDETERAKADGSRPRACKVRRSSTSLALHSL